MVWGLGCRLSWLTYNYHANSEILKYGCSFIRSSELPGAIDFIYSISIPMFSLVNLVYVVTLVLANFMVPNVGGKEVKQECGLSLPPP